MSTVGGDLHGLAVELRRLPFSSMIAAAKASKKLVADEGARIAGPDGMKGKKRRGLKLKARDDIREIPDGTLCRVQGTVPGWVWANTGTRPHAIRRRKRGPLKKSFVSHPGTTGRGAWERVAVRVAAVVPLIFDDELDRTLRGW